MKKFKSNILFFYLLSLLILNNAFSQKKENHILLDAIKLKEMILTPSNNDFITFKDADAMDAAMILKGYLKNMRQEYKDIYGEYQSNPFIKLPYKASQSNDTVPNKPETSLSLSSLDVITNFAFGLTDFLIKRAKMELNIAFFKRFKDEMTKDEFKDLKILFPQTFQMLSAIGDQI